MRCKAGMLSRRVTPVLHLDASNVSSITVSGGNPVSISDLSGTFDDYGVEDIASIVADAKNGLQAIHCQSSSQFASLFSAPVSATAASWKFLHTGKSNVFVVMRSPSVAGVLPDYTGLSFRTFTTTRGYLASALRRETSYNVQAYARSSTVYAFRNQPNAWGSATWRLMHISADASAPSCTINISGTEYTTLTDSGSAVNLDCDAPLYVDCSGDGTSGSASVFGELLVFGEMDAAHAAETRSALTQKWGL